MDPRKLLEKLIERAGLTPHSLAAKLKRPALQGQLWRFLNGKTADPRRKTLEPVAAYFRVPLEAFFDESVADRVAAERGLLSGEALAASDVSAPDIVVMQDGRPRLVIEFKASTAGEPSLTLEELERLTAAVLDLPRKKAVEWMDQITREADEYRQYGNAVLRRFKAGEPGEEGHPQEGIEFTMYRDEHGNIVEGEPPPRPRTRRAG